MRKVLEQWHYRYSSLQAVCSTWKGKISRGMKQSGGEGFGVEVPLPFADVFPKCEPAVRLHYRVVTKC